MGLTQQIEWLRRTNAEALQAVLSSDLDQSEVAIADAWRENLRAIPEVYPFGWYDPPPGGVSVLIAHPDEYKRLRFKSLREDAQWPRADVSLSADSLLYAYSSPLSRSSLLIGDICLTLYSGKDARIQEHLRQVLDITYEIAEHAQVGMRLRDVFEFASRIIESSGLRNEIFSITDPCAFDVGHTIPWSYSPLTEHEKLAVSSSNDRGLMKMVSSNREFLNAENDLLISDTMAFTVEPRLSGGSLPPITFHLTVVFEEGRKSIIAGYESLLRLSGMHGYLSVR